MLNDPLLLHLHSAFHVGKPVRDGRVIDPTGTYTSDIFLCVLSLPTVRGEASAPDRASHHFRSPEEFECAIRQRSREAEALVRATATT